MQNYTEEQIKDITEREQKALNFLKELKLSPAASIQKVNIGGDAFADKLIPFLRDFKYDPVPSPIQHSDLNKGDEASPESK